jgi:hypothetical protein
MIPGRRGVLISQDKEGGPCQEYPLRRCIHCGRIWVHRPGSGRLRGFCTRCFGDVCGEPDCVARGCLHWEAQLAQLERGIPWELTSASWEPVQVSVPAAMPPQEDSDGSGCGSG